MFIEKLRNKICLKFLLVIMAGTIFGCSNLSLKEENNLKPVKTVSISTSLTNHTVPAWISSLVADLNSKPVPDSPESIVQYQYKGKFVYYFAPACCGKMSNLYDEEKKLICKPDGGKDGKSDGNCPDFMTERINEKLIWAENRD